MLSFPAPLMFPGRDEKRNPALAERTTMNFERRDMDHDAATVAQEAEPQEPPKE